MSTTAAFVALMGCTAGLIVGAITCFAWEALATPRLERPSRLMFAGACVLAMTVIPWAPWWSSITWPADRAHLQLRSRLTD